jgi:sulfonate transport system substrate-binding protein
MEWEEIVMKVIKGLFRKRLLLVAAVVMSLGLLTGCGAKESSDGGSDSGEKTVIRVGVQNSIPIPYLAEVYGYFEDEFKNDNVTVELKEFSLGPAIIEAVNSGDLDIGFLGDVPTLSGLVNGGSYKIIGRYESAYSSYLIARDDANIKNLSDLKGKKLAYAFGSTQTALVYGYLEDAGLSDTDVELVNLSFADIITSIANGNIDAAVVDELRATTAVNNGGVSKIKNSEGYKLFVNPIIATNDFSSKNPELVARVLKVLQKTALYVADHQDEAVAKAAERIGVDKSSIEAIIKNYNLEVLLTSTEIEAMKTNAKAAYKYGVIKSDLDVSKYIDTSYLEKAGLQ